MISESPSAPSSLQAGGLTDDRERAGPRFLFIDGLRGIAAVAVVLFHFNHAVELRASAAEPRIVHWALSYCWLGVEVFFVISGFVIVHSLRNATVSWPFLGRFALRRSIRLDPAYWCVLAINFGMLLYSQHAHPDRSRFPVAGVFAYLTYTQFLLRFPDILTISWTLCLEVQFYLILIFLLRFLQKNGERGFPTWAPIVMLVSAVASASIAQYSWATNAWFAGYWYMFAAGALSYFAWMRRLPAGLFFGYLTFIAASSIWTARLEPLMVASTAAIVYAVALRDEMERWLRGPVIQFMGKISYSLYLGHATLLTVAVSAYGNRQNGWGPGKLLGWQCGVLLLGVGLSLGIFYLVELPSHRLAKRLRPNPPAVESGSIV